MPRNLEAGAADPKPGSKSTPQACPTRNPAMSLARHAQAQRKHLSHRARSSVKIITSSNHRLESAGLNALEQLLFLKYWIGNREDGNTCLVFESMTENWRYFRSYLIKYLIRSRRNVYLLKIEAKSFRDTGNCKDTESTSNLGPIAGF